MLKLKTRPVAKPRLYITGEQLAQMRDVGGCDLIKGEIRHKMPTKRTHGRVSALIITYLNLFNLTHRLGEVYASETGVYTQRNPDTVRGMDGAFISHERLQGAAEDSFLTVAPEIVVEVLSRSNTRREINEKLVEYFDIGVVQVWIVNSRKEELHVYRSATKFERLTTQETLTCEAILPGFRVSVADIFAK